MESISTRRITRSGIIALVYVVLTVTLPLSYGNVQLRLAEALMLLCLFSKDYIYSLTVGCLVANIYVTSGIADTAVGTLATLAGALCIYLLRDRLNLLTASIFPVVIKALSISIKLRIIANTPIRYSIRDVAIGEVICCTILGGILIMALTRNKEFRRIISDDIDNKSMQRYK